MISAPGKYYVYAVIDKAATPATVLAVRLTRQQARNEMDQYDGSRLELRVRRAKLVLFET